MAKTIEYLESLDAGPVPRVVADGDELDLVRVLRGAGWVYARLPDGRGAPAVVEGMTFAGRAVLAKARSLRG